MVEGSVRISYGLGPPPPERGLAFPNRSVARGRHDPTVLAIADAFVQIEVHDVEVEALYVSPDTYAHLRSLTSPPAVEVVGGLLEGETGRETVMGATLISTPAIPSGFFVLVPEDLISIQLVSER